MARAMAEAAPTVAAVRCKSFGRAKIVEALELFGVSAHPRTGARALKAKLVELIESGAALAPGGEDRMGVDSAAGPVPAPGPRDEAAERDNPAVRDRRAQRLLP